MDLTNHQSMVQEATKSAFRGRKNIEAKGKPYYPHSPEREFQRVCRAYMKLVKKALRNHLPEIIDACSQARTDSRFDAYESTSDRIQKAILEIAEEIEQATNHFGLDDYVDKIAGMMNAQSTREWRKLVHKTLGINIMEDYYKGEVYRNALNLWVADNVSLIKSIPSEMLDDMEGIILNGYRNGVSIRELEKMIQDRYDVTKRKAELLARDQLAKLNAAITKMQQTDAGVKKYRWQTSGDVRVRECHAELDGKIINWDDPPEMWYETKNGIVYTGRHCHPGEDYQCRCVAIPIFDWQTVDLPIEETQSK